MVAHLQGNYSDLLVQLSNIHSQLRGDTSGQKNEDSAQVNIAIKHVILLWDNALSWECHLLPCLVFLPLYTYLFTWYYQALSGTLCRLHDAQLQIQCILTRLTLSRMKIVHRLRLQKRLLKAGDSKLWEAVRASKLYSIVSWKWFEPGMYQPDLERSSTLWAEPSTEGGPSFPHCKHPVFAKCSWLRDTPWLQGFVRSTTKYWVRNADVSTVKHHILQHLPVFQYNVGDEDQQDAQLINSVYMDNSSMELYHGRLDKRPNAIALRIRSVSTDSPQEYWRPTLIWGQTKPLRTYITLVLPWWYDASHVYLDCSAALPRKLQLVLMEDWLQVVRRRWAYPLLCGEEDAQGKLEGGRICEGKVYAEREPDGAVSDRRFDSGRCKCAVTTEGEARCQTRSAGWSPPFTEILALQSAPLVWWLWCHQAWQHLTHRSIKPCLQIRW